MLHLATNADAGQIVASALTDRDADDGAYDRDDIYTVVPSEAAETAPTQRDAHLRCIAERGRAGWQRASGYGWRAGFVSTHAKPGVTSWTANCVYAALRMARAVAARRR
jgi:hypothetical protein